MRLRRTWLSPLAVALIALVSGGWLLQEGTANEDAYTQSKLLDEVLRLVAERYVEETEPAELYRNAGDATFEDVTEGTGMLTLLGPGSSELVAETGLVAGVPKDVLDGLGEDETLSASGPNAVRIVRTHEARGTALDLIAAREVIREF